jgi:hypothetical protein
MKRISIILLAILLPLNIIYWILNTNFVFAKNEIPNYPSVKILSPIGGKTYGKIDILDFAFEVNNFTFVDFKGNTVPFPGNPYAGHAYIWIDKSGFGLNLEDAALKILSVDAVNLGGLSIGRHTVTIELVQNNKEPFDPPVRDDVAFWTLYGTPGSIGKLTYKSEDVAVPVGEKHFLAVPTYIMIAVLVAIFSFIWWRYKKAVKLLYPRIKLLYSKWSQRVRTSYHWFIDRIEILYFKFTKLIRKLKRNKR